MCCLCNIIVTNFHVVRCCHVQYYRQLKVVITHLNWSVSVLFLYQCFFTKAEVNTALAQEQLESCYCCCIISFVIEVVNVLNHCRV